MELPSQYYRPSYQKIWQGRADSGRYHQKVICEKLPSLLAAKEKSFALLGFACDEGVKRNQGRPGAAAGPQALRQALANLPCHRSDIEIIDCGDILCADNNLEQAQSHLASAVAWIREQGYQPIVLGGGHETAWGHYQGLRKGSEQAFSIINFDAHLDMRPLSATGQGSSGTPFLQIKEACDAIEEDFLYSCFGLQGLANTATLFQTAAASNVCCVFAEDFHRQENDKIRAVLQAILEQPYEIYCSFCLDVLSAAIAKGVSAPQSDGLWLNQVIPLIRLLAQSGKVVGFDVVELAPALDESDLTAKTAAYLIAEWMQIFHFTDEKTT